MKEKIKSFFQRINPYVSVYSVSIAIPLAVGITSAAITRDGMNIYEKLSIPPLAPPSWVFPIVWTLLFILMGISSAMIFTNRKANTTSAKSGLKNYGISLALNFLWSIVFFNLQAAFFALIILIILLFSIIKTIVDYFKVNEKAAYLQLPYAIWVAFAGYLNLVIWIIN